MDIHGASQCFSHSTYLLSYAQSVILLAVRSYDISIFVFQHTKEYLRMVNGNSSLCDMCLLRNQKKVPLSGGNFIINRSQAHIFVLHPELRVTFMGKVARCTTYLYCTQASSASINVHCRESHAWPELIRNMFLSTVPMLSSPHPTSTARHQRRPTKTPTSFNEKHTEFPPLTSIKRPLNPKSCPDFKHCE